MSDTSIDFTWPPEGKQTGSETVYLATIELTLKYTHAEPSVGISGGYDVDGSDVSRLEVWDPRADNGQVFTNRHASLRWAEMLATLTHPELCELERQVELASEQAARDFEPDVDGEDARDWYDDRGEP